MLRNKKGFTLIELMVVIVIIGILAALAIPKFTSASDKAKWSEAPTVLAAYDNAQLARLSETNALGALAELVFEAPAASKWFTYTEQAAGNYSAEVAGSPIGGVAVGDGIQTTVATDATVTHAVYNGAAAADINKMIPNFL
jgi:prepilin-type N-terminal cleavage/methylation domain-containing protein